MQEYLNFASSLADRARSVLKAQLDLRQSFTSKDDASPVTLADQAVEQALRAMIAERYPEHGILGEEYAAQSLDAEYVWVIDPIDGTKAFIAGFPVYGTLIALTRHGRPVLGVIEHPFTLERWLGCQGLVTTYNGQPIAASQETDLAKSLVSIGNPEAMQGAETAAMSRLCAASRWRIYGGSCYAYACLASGRVQVVLDSGLDPFDYCALVPVIEGAGGRITDWEGQPLGLNSGHRVVACANQALLEQALGVLQQR